MSALANSAPRSGSVACAAPLMGLIHNGRFGDPGCSRPLLPSCITLAAPADVSARCEAPSSRQMVRRSDDHFSPPGFDHLKDHLSSCGDTISDEFPLLSDDHPRPLGLSLWMGIRSPRRKWPPAFGLRGRARGTPTQVLSIARTRTIGKGAVSHGRGAMLFTHMDLDPPPGSW
jgi:hypothetical protein